MALEICNTLAGWKDASPKDYLDSYGHLVVWAQTVGMLSGGEATRLRDLAIESPREAAGVLRRAKSFRSGLYRVATGSADSSSTTGRVEMEIRRSMKGTQLAPGGAGPSFEVMPDTLDAPLMLAAQHAWRMIDRRELAHVGQCPGECCGWLFYDPDRRRRWCVMEVCGNREKLRRHRESLRQKALLVLHESERRWPLCRERIRENLLASREVDAVGAHRDGDSRERRWSRPAQDGAIVEPEC